MNSDTRDLFLRSPIIAGYELKRWLKFQKYNTAKSALTITKWARASIARRKAFEEAVEDLKQRFALVAGRTSNREEACGRG